MSRSNKTYEHKTMIKRLIGQYIRQDRGSFFRKVQPARLPLENDAIPSQGLNIIGKVTIYVRNCMHMEKNLENCGIL